MYTIKQQPTPFAMGKFREALLPSPLDPSSSTSKILPQRASRCRTGISRCTADLGRTESLHGRPRGQAVRNSCSSALLSEAIGEPQAKGKMCPQRNTNQNISPYFRIKV
jgi:hypothetical protein